MKVLMTTDTVGGVWTYALELSQALKPLGISVALATMGEPLSESQLEQVARLDLEVHESAFKLEWMSQPWDEVAEAGHWLLELERLVSPDVVHLNGYAHGALRWRVPRLVVAHSCVFSWWQAVHGEEPPVAWRRYREEITRGLKRADLVLAPTWAMLTALQSCYGSLGRLGVIPNGRDPRGFDPAPKQPLVLAAGRIWDEAKNITALDAVAEDLHWPVCVAGDQRHPDTGQQVVLKVRSLGQLAPAALAQWMGRASIYALPARYEPFGLSALEAALCGCALVLGDLPSLREVWGDAAVYVPPSDHEALRETINGLIDDEARRDELAQRARQRARQFTTKRMAQSYRQAYRLLLRQRSGPVAEA